MAELSGVFPLGLHFFFTLVNSINFFHTAAESTQLAFHRVPAGNYTALYVHVLESVW